MAVKPPDRQKDAVPLAKALVAKHASRSSDFAFTDKVRSKVRKYVDEYVERKGAELRK